VEEGAMEKTGYQPGERGSCIRTKPPALERGAEEKWEKKAEVGLFRGGLLRGLVE